MNRKDISPCLCLAKGIHPPRTFSIFTQVSRVERIPKQPFDLEWSLVAWGMNLEEAEKSEERNEKGSRRERGSGRLAEVWQGRKLVLRRGFSRAGGVAKRVEDARGGQMCRGVGKRQDWLFANVKLSSTLPPTHVVRTFAPRVLRERNDSRFLRASRIGRASASPGAREARFRQVEREIASLGTLNGVHRSLKYVDRGWRDREGTEYLMARDDAGFKELRT